jgi:hypothetical protein
MSSVTYKKVKHLIPKGIGVFVIDANLKAVLQGRSTKNEVDPEIRLNVVTRMAYRSANVTRHSRKSKTSGAKLVAKTAVDALYEIAGNVLPNKTSAVLAVTKAINKFV